MNEGLAIGVGLLAVAGAYWLLSKRKAAPKVTHEKRPDMFIANLPGYRRMRNEELTPELTRRAYQVLWRPVGYIEHIGNGRAAAVEHHFSQERGRHKGVSLFVKL